VATITAQLPTVIEAALPVPKEPGSVRHTHITIAKKRAFCQEYNSLPPDPKNPNRKVMTRKKFAESNGLDDRTFARWYKDFVTTDKYSSEEQHGYRKRIRPV
jgi:hypothetical protein